VGLLRDGSPPIRGYQVRETLGENHPWAPPVATEEAAHTERQGDGSASDGKVSNAAHVLTLPAACASATERTGSGPSPSAERERDAVVADGGLQQPESSEMRK
jgi:hypothetical protein